MLSVPCLCPSGAANTLVCRPAWTQGTLCSTNQSYLRQRRNVSALHLHYKEKSTWKSTNMYACPKCSNTYRGKKMCIQLWQLQHILHPATRLTAGLVCLALYHTVCLSFVSIQACGTKHCSEIATCRWVDARIITFAREAKLQQSRRDMGRWGIFSGFYG